jgi:hypothetical protein
MAGDDDRGAHVPLDQEIDHRGHPIGHLPPGLAARIASQVRVPAAIGEGIEPVVLVPWQPIALAGVVLAQVTVLHDVQAAQGRRQHLRGLHRSRHHAGVERRHLPQLSGRLPAVAQRLHLQAAPR